MNWPRLQIKQNNNLFKTLVMKQNKSKTKYLTSSAVSVRWSIIHLYIPLDDAKRPRPPPGLLLSSDCDIPLPRPLCNTTQLSFIHEPNHTTASNIYPVSSKELPSNSVQIRSHISCNRSMFHFLQRIPYNTNCCCCRTSVKSAQKLSAFHS